MNARRNSDLLIKAFLDDGVNELPDRSYDAVRAAIDQTRQWAVIGPWREQRMNRFAILGTAAAAIVLAVVIGVRFLPGSGGVGGPPVPSVTPTDAAPPTAVVTPTATVTPTPAPGSSTAPVADPNGRLQPGTYVAHPFDTILGMDARGFTFEVPSANWDAHGDRRRTIGIAWNDGSGNSDGVGLGFLKVHSLNSDGCDWTTDDDIEIGPTADDLLSALTAPNTTGFSPGDPYTEQIANMTGHGIELTMQSPLPTGCDEGAFRIWNAEGFDIYAQGSWNVWRLGVFDVDGERYVLMASYMPDTPDQVRSEMMEIFRSVRIDSSPGCSRYDHNCN